MNESIPDWIQIALALLTLFTGGYIGGRAPVISRIRMEERRALYDIDFAAFERLVAESEPNGEVTVEQLCDVVQPIVVEVCRRSALLPWLERAIAYHFATQCKAYFYRHGSHEDDKDAEEISLAIEGMIELWTKRLRPRMTQRWFLLRVTRWAVRKRYFPWRIDLPVGGYDRISTTDSSFTITQIRRAGRS